MKTISDLKKVMIREKYENVYGSPTIEYYFKDIDAWIERLGNKIIVDRKNPYNVRYKTFSKNFKTLDECLKYILCKKYITDCIRV